MFKKNIAVIIPLVIIALGVVVYANSLKAGFLWDDGTHIEENGYIRSYSNIPEVFTHTIGGGIGKESLYYRPVQTLSYMLDYSIWGLSPRGYHISSIIVHILTALCVYILINLLFSDRLLAAVSAMLFVVHPIHTEAVTYVSGRADSLAGLFILLSLIFFIKELQGRQLFLIPALACYMLALLSRENSIILPALLLLYHCCFRKRPDLKRFAAVTAVTAAYILLRISLSQMPVLYQGRSLLFFERIPGFFAAIADYIRLLFLPLGLHMEYGERLFALSNPKAILGMIVTLLLLIYLFRKRPKDAVAFFSISWFFIALIPHSNIYPPLNAYMAEHWLYIPSIGFFLIIARGLEYLYSLRNLKIYAAGLLIALLTFYSYLTIRQNIYWQKPIKFYERSLRYTPESARVNYNLANAYVRIGKADEAMDLYERSIESVPTFTGAYINLGSCYFEIGDFNKAISLYNKAVEIEPDYTMAYYNLGKAYEAAGKINYALNSYKKAVELDGSIAFIHNSLGNVYSKMKRYEDAISSYERAIELDPEFAYAYNNLALVYRDTGRYEEAIGLCRSALDINPGLTELYNSLGSIYTAKGDYNQAIDSYKKALSINPAYGPAHFNLSLAYYYNGQHEMAVAECNRAIESGQAINPDYLQLLEEYKKSNGILQ